MIVALKILMSLYTLWVLSWFISRTWNHNRESEKLRKVALITHFVLTISLPLSLISVIWLFSVK